MGVDFYKFWHKGKAWEPRSKQISYSNDWYAMGVKGATKLIYGLKMFLWFKYVIWSWNSNLSITLFRVK